MRAVRPKRMEQRLPEIPEPSPGLHAASEGKQPLRVVMVNNETFVLTYVWHLTAFFERVYPTGLRGPMYFRQTRLIYEYPPSRNSREPKSRANSAKGLSACHIS